MAHIAIKNTDLVLQLDVHFLAMYSDSFFMIYTINYVNKVHFNNVLEI